MVFLSVLCIIRNTRGVGTFFFFFFTIIIIILFTRNTNSEAEQGGKSLTVSIWPQPGGCDYDCSSVFEGKFAAMICLGRQLAADGR